MCVCVCVCVCACVCVCVCNFTKPITILAEFRTNLTDCDRLLFTINNESNTDRTYTFDNFTELMTILVEFGKSLTDHD